MASVHSATGGVTGAEATIGTGVPLGIIRTCWTLLDVISSTPRNGRVSLATDGLAVLRNLPQYSEAPIRNAQNLQGDLQLLASAGDCLPDLIRRINGRGIQAFRVFRRSPGESPLSKSVQV